MRSRRTVGRWWFTLPAAAALLGFIGVPAIHATAATPPHVMEIMEENQSYSSVIGSSNAPYINSLASANALATQWFGNEHVSWKDYNIAIGGKDYASFGSKGYPTVPAADKTVVNELDTAGVSWKGYMDSMPSACDRTSSGDYDAGHDPFVHFHSIVDNTSECDSHVVPYSQSGMTSDLNSGSAPNFVWVTPDQCHDMHSACGGNAVTAGDNWLKTFIPAVKGTTWYSSGGIIIITWDEGATSDTAGCCGDPGGGHIPTLVVSASSSGQFTSAGDHDGTLHAIEKAYGVGYLSPSGSGHGDLSGAFGGGSTTPGTITGTVTDKSTSQPISGASVTCTCGVNTTTATTTGTYTLSNVMPGTYSLTFAHSGYQNTTLTGVHVSPAATTTTNAQLTPGTSAPAVVQDVEHAAGAAATSATISTSASSPAMVATSAGDLLVLAVEMDAGSATASGAVSSVTDSTGTDTWIRAVAVNPSTRIGAEIWYLANAPAGVTSVTANFSKNENPVLRFYELSGVSSLDQIGPLSSGTSNSPSTSSTPATTASNEILVAVVGFAGTSVTISGLTPGFTSDTLVRNSATNFNESEQAGHEIVSSTGTYAYSGTLSGSPAWGALIATFR